MSNKNKEANNSNQITDITSKDFSERLGEQVQQGLSSQAELEETIARNSEALGADFREYQPLNNQQIKTLTDGGTIADMLKEAGIEPVQQMEPRDESAWSREDTKMVLTIGAGALVVAGIAYGAYRLLSGSTDSTPA